jgi:hypothetical protein
MEKTVFYYLASECFLLSFVASFIVGLLIFLMGLYWKNITFYFKRELSKFRVLFGEKTVNDAKIFITIDTYVFDHSSSSQHMPFYKIFPDGHITQFTGTDDEIQRYCSTRAASYIIDGFRNVRGINVIPISDDESRSK